MSVVWGNKFKNMSGHSKMKIFLYTMIPAIWFWAITLSVVVQDYLQYPPYQELGTASSLFATLIFPAIAFYCHWLLIDTIKKMSKSE
jgi:dolichyl-phosphate-mannose--protein O-mannosyl transferase